MELLNKYIVEIIIMNMIIIIITIIKSLLATISLFSIVPVNDTVRVAVDVLDAWKNKVEYSGDDWVAAVAFDAFVVLCNTAATLGLLYILTKLIILALAGMIRLSLCFFLQQREGLVKGGARKSEVEVSGEERGAEADAFHDRVSSLTDKCAPLQGCVEEEAEQRKNKKKSSSRFDCCRCALFVDCSCGDEVDRPVVKFDLCLTIDCFYADKHDEDGDELIQVGFLPVIEEGDERGERVEDGGVGRRQGGHRGVEERRLGRRTLAHRG